MPYRDISILWKCCLYIKMYVWNVGASEVNLAGLIITMIIHFSAWLKNDIICLLSSIWTLIAWPFMLELGSPKCSLNGKWE